VNTPVPATTSAMVAAVESIRNTPGGGLGEPQDHQGRREQEEDARPQPGRSLGRNGAAPGDEWSAGARRPLQRPAGPRADWSRPPCGPARCQQARHNSGCGLPDARSEPDSHEPRDQARVTATEPAVTAYAATGRHASWLCSYPRLRSPVPPRADGNAARRSRDWRMV
jgi:hypothetical protein